MNSQDATTESVTDAIGQHHPWARGPVRIVSLVPSITELLFDLGLEAQIVGRTSYCVHPAPRVVSVPSVGGTKKVKMTRLKALQPTHVIVNVDENRREMAEAIRQLGAQVVVTHPRSPEDNLALYELLGTLFGRRREAAGLSRRFRAALERVRQQAARLPRRQVLYLIWRNPWMTVSRDTYISRMLQLVGWMTYPAGSSLRYPSLAADSVDPECIDLVAFSSEPCAFTREDMLRFGREFGIPRERLLQVDGELISWYGSRALRGVDYLLQVAERV